MKLPKEQIIDRLNQEGVFSDIRELKQQLIAKNIGRLESVGIRFEGPDFLNEEVSVIKVN